MSNTSILIAVTSAPGNFQLREAIRETWAKDLSTKSPRGNTTSCHVIFVLGLPNNTRSRRNITLEENEQNKDADEILKRITGAVSKMKPITLSVLNFKKAIEQ